MFSLALRGQFSLGIETPLLGEGASFPNAHGEMSAHAKPIHIIQTLMDERETS